MMLDITIIIIKIIIIIIMVMIIIIEGGPLYKCTLFTSTKHIFYVNLVWSPFASIKVMLNSICF